MELLTKQLEIMGLQDWLWDLIKHAIEIIKRYDVVIGDIRFSNVHVLIIYRKKKRKQLINN